MKVRKNERQRRLPKQAVGGRCLPRGRIWVCSLLSYTVPVKCKMTVSTRNSILDTRCFRESSFEARVSSFEFRVLSFEFRDTRRIFRENDLYLEFATIELNNTAHGAASFIRARVHIFHVNVQIVSLELKSWSTIIQYSLQRINNIRTTQPNSENAACEHEIIFLVLSGSSELKFQLACRMQISECYCDYANSKWFPSLILYWKKYLSRYRACNLNIACVGERLFGSCLHWQPAVIVLICIMFKTTPKDQAFAWFLPISVFVWSNCFTLYRLSGTLGHDKCTLSSRVKTLLTQRRIQTSDQQSYWLDDAKRCIQSAWSKQRGCWPLGKLHFSQIIWRLALGFWMDLRLNATRRSVKLWCSIWKPGDSNFWVKIGLTLERSKMSLPPLCPSYNV